MSVITIRGFVITENEEKWRELTLKFSHVHIVERSSGKLSYRADRLFDLVSLINQLHNLIPVSWLVNLTTWLQRLLKALYIAHVLRLVIKCKSRALQYSSSCIDYSFIKQWAYPACIGTQIIYLLAFEVHEI